jgi:MoxR-like ATPase
MTSHKLAAVPNNTNPLPSAIDAAVAQANRMRADLGARFFEREREITGALVALMTGTNVVLVGDPGTGKSALVDAVLNACGLTTFRTLCHRQQTTEELFGPLDLVSLQAGRYKRVADGSITDVDAAFLDEVFKASGVTLNPLLRALNEHETSVPGQGWAPIPLRAAFMASNELPRPEDGLEAFLDRVTLRFDVRYIRSRDNAIGMVRAARMRDLDRLNGVAPTPVAGLTKDQLETLVGATIAMPVTDAAEIAMCEIVDKLRAEGVQVSDRTRNAMDKVVRAAAVLAGATEATTVHLDILKDVLWSSPEQKPLVDGTVDGQSATWVRELSAAMRSLDEQEAVINGAVKLGYDAGVAALSKASKACKGVEAAITEIVAHHADARADASRASERAKKLRADVSANLRLLGLE